MFVHLVDGSSSFLVLKKHLRAKYSGAVKDVSMRMWRNCASYLLVSELAAPQLTPLFAESQARSVSVTTLSQRSLSAETLCGQHDTGQPSFLR